jgi:hypothetical protein
MEGGYFIEQIHFGPAKRTLKRCFLIKLRRLKQDHKI